MVFTSRNWFAMQVPVAIILISWNVIFIRQSIIKVITKLPNSEQSYKGKVQTHNYINRQNQSTTVKLWKLYFPYHFTIFFCIFHIISLFSLLLFRIFQIISLFNWYFFHIKRYGKYGRKASQIVKRYEHFGRKLWIDMENTEENCDIIWKIQKKSMLFTIQPTFVPYFPNHFTIQFIFLPYCPYFFTIQHTFLLYFPYNIAIFFCI
jgi:hypothetical protein